MEGSITIRCATPYDREAVERLAVLDSSHAPRGRVLLAYVDGEPLGALGVDDGHVVADPFRHTAGLVALLGARGRQLQAAGIRPAPARRWNPVLAWRSGRPG